MTITNSTVSGNSTTDIGGIFNNGGTIDYQQLHDLR